MNNLSRKDLLKRLKEEGLTYTYANFLLRYEKTGQLKVRRNPLTGFREFTQDEIEGIIDAVKKDGRSFVWHAKEE